MDWFDGLLMYKFLSGWNAIYLDVCIGLSLWLLNLVVPLCHVIVGGLGRGELGNCSAHRGTICGDLFRKSGQYVLETSIINVLRLPLRNSCLLDVLAELGH